MKAYLSIFRMRRRMETQYRGAVLGGLICQVFFGIILVAIYRALYAGKPQVMPLSHVTTYVWLQQAFFRMLLATDPELLDSYSLLRDIYRVPEEDYRKRLKELAEALDLGDLLRTPLRLLSLGQRMRAELCGSLLHTPELLFLDEPSIGLDAVSKLALRDFLLWENREKGTTILLTTHDMEDIAALCSRVMVIGHGEKLYDGGLQEMLAKYDTKRTVQVEEHRNIDHVIADMYRNLGI